uniref:Uncharacterized protein n=1 Tax=Arundo donax TaxID=35708 RepID=A0A0A9FD74_ARUDO
MKQPARWLMNRGDYRLPILSYVM